MRLRLALAALSLSWTAPELASAQAPSDAQPAQAISPAPEAASPSAPSDSAPAASATAAPDSPSYDAGLTAYGSEPLRDPWEKWNRKVFAFNNAVDRTLAEPFAKTYKKVTPTVVRSGVRNWVANLDAPVVFINDLLQGAPKRAGITAARFGINTTVGILGLFDAAYAMGLPRHSEDFGQTIGRYGGKPGPYLMLPILGPSTTRDAFGSLVDLGLDPLHYGDYDGKTTLLVTRAAASLVTSRTDALDAAESLRATSTDPYVTLRTIYGLSRQSEIRNGQQNVQDLPDFGDPMEDEGAGLMETPKQ
jgi:phospholipid-binding lipoprotein MlaA